MLIFCIKYAMLHCVYRNGNKGAKTAKAVTFETDYPDLAAFSIYLAIK